MTHMLFAMPGNDAMAQELARLSGAQLGSLEMRSFPDGESYARLQTEVRGKDCAIVCTLARPDAQIMPLILAAGALREWGASHVRLIAPYLPYLRQDAHFREGEALSAKHFARLISASVDSLVTVDPHLHRIRSLDEIYAIPVSVRHAAPSIGAWISRIIEQPLLIGPDAESGQWVAAAAEAAGAEFVRLTKERRGDRSVALQWPTGFASDGRTPVVVDDVASSGATLIALSEGLAERGFKNPICVVAHALFDSRTHARLLRAYSRIVSTNTVAHPTNAISIADILV